MGSGTRIIGLEWKRENVWENTAYICVIMRIYIYTYDGQAIDMMGS
jgi:hypothetical protein